MTKREWEHTALPWSYYWRTKGEHGSADYGILHKDSGIAYSVCRCPKLQTKEQWTADATFIIDACNQHYNLKEQNEALRECLKLADKRLDYLPCPQCEDKSGAYYDSDGDVIQCQWCDENNQLKQALKLTEGNGE